MITHVVGAMLALAAGAATWAWETRRKPRPQLPAYPSHIEALSGPTTPLTRYLAAVHDLTMTITGAWNAAHARSSPRPIEHIIQRDVLRSHRTELMEASKDLARLLEPYETVARELSTLQDLAEKAWWKSHTDHHREEPHRIQMGVDALGNPEYRQRIRRVYEGTTHTFDYDEEVGSLVFAFVKHWEPPSWPEVDTGRDRIDVSSLNPTARSFLERLLGLDRVTDDQLEDYLNRWVDGRRVTEPLQAIRENALLLSQKMRKVEGLEERVESRYEVRTLEQTDAGPAGYRFFHDLTRVTRRIIESWEKVDAVVVGTNALATQVLSWAEDPSIIESDLDYLSLAAEASALTFREPGVRAELSLPARLPRPTLVAAATWVLFYLVLAIV